MSIVLGLKPESQSTISPELEARGINRLRCTLSELRAYAVPTALQVAFRQYTTLLPAFMSSCINQVNADVRQTCHPVTLKFTQSAPFEYPSLCVTPKSGGVEIDQALLSLGGTLNLIRKEKVFEFKHPNSDLFKALNKMDLKKTSQASDNMVNLAAIESYRLTVRVFSEFFCVHRYPAYIDASHLWSHGVDTTFEWEMDGKVGEKRKRHESDDVAEASRSRRTAAAKVANVNTDVPAQDKSTGRGFDAIARIKNIPTRALFPWAKSISELPSTDGLFVPYHPALFFFDIHMVCSVLNQYFIGSLGTTKEGAIRMMETLKGDWGVIGKTEAGKVLAHVAFCIRLALAAQARPVPLFLDGRYSGTFISGYGYIVKVNGDEYYPKPFETVLAEIEKTSTHSSILAKILTLAGVSGSLDDGMSDLAKTVRDPKFGMMSLRARCLLARMSIKDRDEVLSLASALDFRAVKWGVNSNSIAMALSLITDVSAPLPTDLPIHHTMLFENDRLDVVWSCFGFTAPSFLPQGGSLISLTAKTYNVTFKKGVETVTETRPFDHFHTRVVTLDTAIEDLKKVRAEGKVGLLRVIRRESKFAERSFDKWEFTKIKEGLDKLANVSVRVPEREVSLDRDVEIEVDEDDV